MEGASFGKGDHVVNVLADGLRLRLKFITDLSNEKLGTRTHFVGADVREWQRTRADSPAKRSGSLAVVVSESFAIWDTFVVVMLPYLRTSVTRPRIRALRWSAGRPSLSFFLRWRIANTVAPLQTCSRGLTVQGRKHSLMDKQRVRARARVEIL